MPATTVIVNSNPFSYFESHQFLKALSGKTAKYVDIWNGLKIEAAMAANHDKELVPLITFAQGYSNPLENFLPNIHQNIKQYDMDFLGYIIFANAEFGEYRKGHRNTWFRYYDLVQDVTDGCMPEGQHFYIRYAKSELETLREYDSSAKFVVASFNHDLENAMSVEQIHNHMGLSSSEKVIPCELNERNSVVKVYLELLKTLEPSAIVDEVRRMLQD